MTNNILSCASVMLLATTALANEPSMSVVPVVGAEAGLANANGIEIAYETLGPRDGEVVLLIQGLGVQLTGWPVELLHALAAAGYRVVVFDNRDVGLSTHLDAAGAPDWAAVWAGLTPGAKPAKLAYTLDDMAKDAVGLMDALDIDAAHLAGASMGGQIAQLVAIHHPKRVLSLTSIMTDTGNPARPMASPEFVRRMPPAPPPGSGADAVVAYGLQTEALLAGPAFPRDDAERRHEIERDFKRAYYPSGGERQLAAGLSAPDRREGLRHLQLPTVVLHGDADPLIPVANAREQAEIIPDAQLVIVLGMGHEMPPAAAPRFATAILAAAQRARDARDRQP